MHKNVTLRISAEAAEAAVYTDPPRGIARILLWGAQKLGGLEERGPGRSPGCQCIFGIFEVHRTLLVERTVPTKPVSLVKKSTQSTIGGGGQGP